MACTYMISLLPLLCLFSPTYSPDRNTRPCREPLHQQCPPGMGPGQEGRRQLRAQGHELSHGDVQCRAGRCACTGGSLYTSEHGRHRAAAPHREGDCSATSAHPLIALHLLLTCTCDVVSQLVVCGQALSHCVNFTLRDIVDNWRNDPSSIYLLEDGKPHPPPCPLVTSMFIMEL